MSILSGEMKKKTIIEVIKDITERESKKNPLYGMRLSMEVIKKLTCKTNSTTTIGEKMYIFLDTLETKLSALEDEEIFFSENLDALKVILAEKSILLKCYRAFLDLPKDIFE